MPIAPAAAELARRDGVLPLTHALGDGEDFELILAVPPGAAQRMLADQPLGVPLTAIGEFVETPGLWQVDADGKQAPLAARGFEH